MASLSGTLQSAWSSRPVSKVLIRRSHVRSVESIRETSQGVPSIRILSQRNVTTIGPLKVTGVCALAVLSVSGAYMIWVSRTHTSSEAQGESQTCLFEESTHADGMIAEDTWR